MLLVPITGKISWRNPPIATICLILINCLVFFIFQFNESEILYEAEDYYLNSGLAEIELENYIDYRNDISVQDPELSAIDQLSDDELDQLYFEMMSDASFQSALEKEEIIFPGHPDYAEWREKRATFDTMLGATTTARYGFIPSEAKPVSFFTYMFLHGGGMHLFGNMVFLWLVGCMLEMGCGRIFFFFTYIMTGLGAVLLFYVIYPDSTVPLVGASGSISGIMGTFTVLYARKKIKIFLSLGFYFNYMQIQGIILLPIWVTNELFQLFFAGVSNVAYVAHIGGLLSGAAIGFINLKYLGIYDSEALEPEPEDNITPLIEQALDQVRQLNLEEGSQLLEQVLHKEPNHIEAMTHLFNARKANPEDPHFHAIAGRLLGHLGRDDRHFEQAGIIYEEYIKLVQKPRLAPTLYLQLSSILSTVGKPETAERIMALFLKQKPDFPGLPSALLRLANGYRRQGVDYKYRGCLKLIHKRYPESNEGRIASENLAHPG